MRRFTEEATRDMTIENLGDYSDGVVAALATRSDLESLVPRWEEHLAKCDALEAKKKGYRRAQNRARVGYRFSDAEFDGVVRVLSAEAYFLAGKDVLAEPYVSFFGAVKAEDIYAFGEAKATAYGRNIVENEVTILGAVDAEATKDILKGHLTNLGQATTALEQAGEAREQAASVMLGLDIDRRKLIRQTITLIAQTEVAILTQYNGRRDLVDAILALETEPRRKQSSAVEEAPPADLADLPM